jgi:hypothetical protein
VARAIQQHAQGFLSGGTVVFDPKTNRSYARYSLLAGLVTELVMTFMFLIVDPRSDPPTGADRTHALLGLECAGCRTRCRRAPPSP